MKTELKWPKKSLMSLAVALALVPIGFYGCGSGDDLAAPTLPNFAQVTEASVQEAALWIAESIPGCTIYTGDTLAASAVASESVITTTSVLTQILAAVSDARNASTAVITPLAVQQFVGDCGGTLDVTDVHADGVTTYTAVFTDFCSLDSTVDPPEQSVVDGTVILKDIGTPSPDGPIITSSEVSTTGLTLISDNESKLLSLDKATVTFGVPAAWDPGVPTESNPDKLNISKATVVFLTETKTYTLSGVNATTYEETNEDTVLNITSGVYTTNSHGSVNVATGQPIVANVDGSWVSGSLSLTGADNSTVVITPTPTLGDAVVNVALNGQPVPAASLQCLGATDMIGL